MKELVKKNPYRYRNSGDLLRASDFIEYDPKTGKISRVDRKNSSGSIDSYGYLILKIKGVQWKAHRLAWAKFYKQSPENNIDHINGNKLDNRISNLRDVKQRINIINRDLEPNPDTGVVGVYLDKSTKGLIAKYTTRILGKTYRFRKLDDAIRFRKENCYAIN